MDSQKLTDDDFKEIMMSLVKISVSERSNFDSSDYSTGRCSVCYEVLDRIVEQINAKNNMDLMLI